MSKSILRIIRVTVKVSMLVLLFQFCLGLSVLGAEWVPGELLVKYKPGVTSAKMEQMNKTMGVTSVRILQAANRDWRVVKFDPLEDVQEKVMQYMKSGLVQYVEPNYIVHLADAQENIPNDPAFVNEPNIYKRYTYSFDITDAIYAWDTITDASSVIVAVVDGGVNYNHEDLKDNMWINPNPTMGDIHGIRITGSIRNGDPMDEYGHGTHIAGTIGARGNNGLGTAGVAWKVQIMACKAISETGNGTASDIYECIAYAREHGAKVVNLSLTVGANGLYPMALKEEIIACHDAGVLCVCAAANEAADNDKMPVYPAGFCTEYDNVISVGSSTREDKISDFSNYGKVNVQLFAPGSDIYSTGLASSLGGNSDYGYGSGTSMATPFVVGAAALCMAAHPGESHREIRDRILNSVDLIPSMSEKCVTGGRINVNNLVNDPVLRIRTQPQDQFGIEGKMATFKVWATGSNITYQWYKGNLAINDATNSFYTIQNLKASDTGNSYTVKVSNGVSSIISEEATLTVIDPTPIGDPAEDFEYEISDGEATITGYLGSHEVVTIPNIIEGYVVRTLGDSSFRTNNFLKKVVVPNTIATIEDWVFTDSQNLKSIELADGLKTIRTWAFAGCKKLTMMIIPDSVKTVGDVAFFNCPGLTSIIIGSGVIYFGDTFGLCDNLESIYFKGNAPIANDSDIEADAIVYYFSGTSGWTDPWCGRPTIAIDSDVPLILNNPKNKVVVAENSVSFAVTAIGPTALTYQWNKDGEAIKGATSSIYTIDSVQMSEAGSYTVTVSNGVNSITSDEAILKVLDPTPIGGSAEDFEYEIIDGEVTITGYLGSNEVVTIPNIIEKCVVRILGDSSFRANNFLKKVVIPNTVISIGFLAFENCANIVTLDMGNSVVTIEGHAFQNCNSLKEVVIPASVTELGDNAFEGCNALTSIYFKGNAPTVGSNVFLSVNQSTIYYFSGTVGWTDPWCGRPTIAVDSDIPLILAAPANQVVMTEDNVSFAVTAISTAALTYQWNKNGEAIKGATSSSYTINNVQMVDAGSYTVTVSDGVNSITSEEATLTVIDSTPIGDPADDFKYEFSDGEVIITGYLGSNEVVTIPNIIEGCLVRILGDSLFRYNSSLKRVVVPNTVTTIGSEAFRGCVNLQEMIIPDSVMTINWAAFMDCASLKNLVISNRCTYIGGSAFERCYALTKLNIPNSVNRIEGSAFRSCYGLKQVLLGEGLTSLGGYVFDLCSGLEIVKIGRGINTIEDRDFGSCSNLTKVIFSGNAPAMCSNTAFEDTQAILYYYEGTIGWTDPWRGRPTVAIDSDIPLILVAPASQVVIAENNVSFNVTAIGTTALTYQWNKDGVAIEGASSPSYTINRVQMADAGSYTVTVSNGVNSITSDEATLTVIDSTPIGDPAADFKYEIFNGEVTITGYLGSNEVVTIPNIIEGCLVRTLGDSSFRANNFLKKVVIPNTVINIGFLAFENCANITELIIGDSVRIIGGHSFQNCNSLKEVFIPASVIELGDNAFEGNSALRSIYFEGNAPIAGSNVFLAVNQSKIYYFSGTTGWTNPWCSRPTVEFVPIPHITKQPQSQTVNIGNSATFAVSASGFAELSYQWYKDEVAISGAISSTYTISSVKENDIGNYKVNVSNKYGFDISDVAVLKVIKNLTVNLSDATVEYGQDAVLPEAQITGLTAGDDVSYTVTTDYKIGAPVGEYRITATVGGKDLVNYDAPTTVNSKLMVTPRTLTVTLAGANVTYGKNVSLPKAKITGLYGQDDVNYTVTTEYKAGSPVGEYDIVATAEGTALGNYDAPATVISKMTVRTRELTVTLDDATVEYGKAVVFPKAKLLGLYAKDDVTYAVTTDYKVGSPVGEYTLTATAGGTALSNYDAPETVTSKLTVTKASLTITAPTQSVVYGSDVPTMEAVLDGVADNDKVTAIVTTTYTKGDKVGTYTTSIGEVTGTENYEVTKVDGKLTVTKATLTVKAEDKTVTYGEEASPYTATYSGFAASDDVSKLSGTLAFDCDYKAGSAVNTYSITPKGLTSENYAITFVEGKLTVTKKALTITAPDQGVIYGEDVPAMEAIIGDLVGNDKVTATVTTTYTKGAKVGDYTTSIGEVRGAENYAESKVDGKLTVTAKELRVTLADATVEYGKEVTLPEAQITGLYGTDDVAYAITTDYQVGSPVGEYAITATAGGTALGNYNAPKTVTSKLTVTKADQTITLTVDPVALKVGESTKISAVSTSGLEVVIIIRDESILSKTGEALAEGTVTITATQDGNENYNAAETVTQTVTVSAKDVLAVWVDNKTIIYGEDAPEYTYTMEPKVEGVTVDLTCTYQPDADAGTYPITATVTGVEKYNVVIENGTLTVEKADPEVSIGTGDPEGAIEIIYGELITDEIANAQSNKEGTFSYEVYEINGDNDPILIDIDPTVTELDAGTYILKAVFTPEDTTNYNEVTVEAWLIVNQAETEITWAIPEPITEGTALSEAQLNATANVEGTFEYNPAEGTVLEAGTHTLTTVFTPASANYKQATASVEIVVNAAIVVELTWETPEPITYGTPLNEEQLNAKANVEGMFVYDPTAGAILNAGTQKLTVIFKPEDSTLKTQYAEVWLIVNKAKQTLTFEPIAEVREGDVFTLSASTDRELPVRFESSDKEIVKIEGNVATVVGSGTVTITAIQDGNENYEAVAVEQTLTISGEEETPEISYSIDEEKGTMILRFTGDLYESEDGKTWTLVEGAKDTYTVDIKQGMMKLYCAGK